LAVFPDWIFGWGKTCF